MSYFIKDGGKAFSDLQGSFEGVTFKPIQNAFSSYVSPIDENQTIGGNHSPWFCVKDGRYPLYNINYDSDGNAHMAVKGWNLPIMTCTISSLSGKYFLTGYNPSDSNSYYGSIQLPSQVFTYYKKDILVKDQNGNVKMNVGCDHIVNNNGNRLRWSCPTTAFDLYRNGKLKTATISDKKNIFFQTFRKDNFKTYNDTMSSYNEADDTTYTAKLENAFDFVNNTPDTDNALWGYDYVPSTDNVYFSTTKIPYYRLRLNDIKVAGYNKLKVSIYALTTFTADFSNTTNRSYDTKFIQNNNNIYNAGDPYCLHFLYQFSQGNVWQNTNYSGTISALTGPSHGMNTVNGYLTTTNYRQLYINSYADAEIQDASTPEFWTHVIPFTVQNYKGDNADTKYYILTSGGTDYITPYTSYYDKSTDTTINLTKRLNVDYSEFGLTKNKALNDTNTWTSFSSEFQVWVPPGSYDCSLLVNGNTYSNSKQSDCKASLTSIPGPNAPLGYKRDWMSIISGSNNYTFGIVSATYTIDLTNHNENYLMITTPAVTFFTCESGPGHVPATDIPGIVHQLEMTYEGTN